ncbi:MAG: hypothetical protein JRG91_01110 [Deltaproteobacteria bacterium]|nr:hypothetical protein [Deltaproteobacteria bacterium]
MQDADVGKIYELFSIVSMLATLLVACTAFVVAIVLSVRRQSIVGAWLLAVGWAGAWLVDVGYLGASFLSGRLEGPVILWVYLGLRLVTLLFGLLTAVALALMRPPRRAPDGEAAHG